MKQTNKEPQRIPFVEPNSSSSGHAASYLGPTIEVKGEITGNEDLKLDSKVDGLVSIGGFRLTVGPGAHLNANVVAREATIAGDVTGDISACDRIEITKSASVVGDLITGKLKIEEGAYFKGGIEIDSHAAQVGTDLDSLLKGAKKKAGGQ